MFRTTFKKRKKTVTRLRSASDDEEDADKKSSLATQQPAKVTTAGGDSEEEEESPVNNNNFGGSSNTSKVNTKKKKKKKKGGLVVRSFDVGEGDDDEDGGGAFSTNKSKKGKKHKRKRGGLGFGGVGLTMKDDDDDAMKDVEMGDSHNINAEDVAGKSESLLYDKGALEKLKQEQKYKSIEKEDPMEESPKKVSQSLGNSVTQEDSNMSDEPTLGEYISLNKNATQQDASNTILTGDDAIQFQDQNRKESENDRRKEEHFDSVTKNATFLDDAADQQQADEASAWEAQISRRAGIQQSKHSNAGSGARDSSSKETHTANSSAVSLSKLREQIQCTISQLETQHHDVDRACDRRRIELTQTQAELQRQEKELKESGKAVDDYQQLREELTFWTGALRDLKSKVDPIQEAFLDLDVDIAGIAEWQNWEDDMCAVLHQAGLLDQVMGRQPPDFVFEDATTVVDEFGRDVKSQHAMGREKRTKLRLEKQAQRKGQLNGDESDALVGEDEIGAFQERRAALAKAFEVALGELDDEYTQLPKLVAIFQRWRASYSEDYKQCFANMSLGDLASVLIAADLCTAQESTSHTARGWLDGLSNSIENENNEVTFEWAAKLAFSLHQSPSKLTEVAIIPEEEVTDRIVEKCFVPVITSIIEKSSYNLVSTKQTRSVSSLLAQLKKMKSSKSHSGLKELENKIVGFITRSLDNIAIAILKDNAAGSLEQDEIDKEGRLKKTELRDVMRDATEGQVLRLSKMLANVLTYWAPPLQAQPNGSGIEDFLLHFLSSKFLFLLSSLRGRSECTSSAFSQVWIALQKTTWLDQPDRVLQTAPLRAAAIAFQAQ